MVNEKKWLAAVLAAVLLTGCGSLEQISLTTESALTVQAPGDAEEIKSLARESVSPDEQEAQETEESFYYGYSSLLTPEEKQLYKEILRSLQNMEKETELETLDSELLDSVFGCVMADHPEIFYADGYTFTTYKLGTQLLKITFSGTYTMDAQTVKERGGQIDSAVRQCFEGLPEQADSYEKAKYLYDWLIGRTEYELDAPDSQNISSVFINGKSVCQGYAKALQYLYQKQGIPSMLVTGRVNGEGHAWDLVRLDGDWYHTDPTWGDAAYLMEDRDVQSKSSYPAVNYDYFCVTTEQIGRTHEIGGDIRLPECTSVAHNYYRREGLYLTSPDLDRVEEIFSRARAQERESVTFQCADAATFRELYRLLIEEQKVFAFLPDSGGKAAYSESKRQLTLSFWL